jgi:hypothetical protein
MDIAMPNLNGIEAARQIVNRNPRTAIAILSMHSDESYVSVGQAIVLCRLPTLPAGGRPQSAMVCPTKVNSIAHCQGQRGRRQPRGTGDL